MIYLTVDSVEQQFRDFYNLEEIKSNEINLNKVNISHSNFNDLQVFMGQVYCIHSTLEN